MLTINSKTCITDTKQDASVLQWLDKAVRRDTDHVPLRCFHVRPNMIETADGFVLHRCLTGDDGNEPGLYALDEYKRIGKTPGSHKVTVIECKFPDTDYIVNPLMEKIAWTIELDKANRDELLWALAIPDMLTAILTINTKGVFSVQKARKEYKRIESTPGATTAYIQHTLVVHPDDSEIKIGVDPKFLNAAVQMPVSDETVITLSFVGPTVGMIVQGIGYQAVVIPMHLGR